MKFSNDENAVHRVNTFDCSGDLIFTRNETSFKVDAGWYKENKGWHFQHIHFHGLHKKNKILRFLEGARVLWKFV